MHTLLPFLLATTVLSAPLPNSNDATHLQQRNPFPAVDCDTIADIYERLACTLADTPIKRSTITSLLQRDAAPDASTVEGLLEGVFESMTDADGHLLVRRDASPDDSTVESLLESVYESMTDADGHLLAKRDQATANDLEARIFIIPGVRLAHNQPPKPPAHQARAPIGPPNPYLGQALNDLFKSTSSNTTPEKRADAQKSPSTTQPQTSASKKPPSSRNNNKRSALPTDEPAKENLLQRIQSNYRKMGLGIGKRDDAGANVGEKYDILKAAVQAGALVRKADVVDFLVARASEGGKGGDSGKDGQPGQPGQPGAACNGTASATATGGKGGDAGQDGQPGQPGADGNNCGDGADGDKGGASGAGGAGGAAGAGGNGGAGGAGGAAGQDGQTGQPGS